MFIVEPIAFFSALLQGAAIELFVILDFAVSVQIGLYLDVDNVIITTIDILFFSG